MEKEKYVTPQATEEVFVANSYIAKCNSYSTSAGNQYRCINPYHQGRYAYENGYPNNYKQIIGYVFVDATHTTCTMKVTSSTLNTRILDENNYCPAYGATVYGPKGEEYICTERHNGYYIPSNHELCYGTYINDGSYNEIIGHFS